MIDSLYIAWKYIQYNRIKTTVLVACITLISFLPFALQLLLNESERQLMSRAVETPLVVSTKGSALDLVMNTLYFGDDVPELMTMTASDRIAGTDLALPVPMYVRFKARGNPIVGNTLDYFEFRGLTIARGRQLAVLGDCVLGAKVAESLALKSGESLVSSPESRFDLAGVYPLKMKVAGILKKSHTSDDRAVFVEWMIWEGQPAQMSVDALQTLGVDSLVFDPCGNVPDQGDFWSVMRKNVENLRGAFQ